MAAIDAPRGRHRGKYSPKEVALAAAFLLPTLAVFVAFFYVPFARLLSWGTYQSVRGGASYEQVGLDQYREVLAMPENQAKLRRNGRI